MPGKQINRRDFLQQSTIIAGGIGLVPLTGFSVTRASEAPHHFAADPLWHHQPLRILQTVMREPDAANYNAQAVVEYMRKTNANALVVNAGGIVDFFQNPLEAANINRFMGKNDVLGDITAACHAAGIKVIGRVDFRGVEEHIFKQFPEWFSYDEAGKPIQLSYTRPQLYASCYTSYHRNEHAVEFISYLMKAYALDGIWHNSIGVGGICHCTRCQEAYRESTGQSLPVMSSPAEQLQQYMTWKTSVADDHMRKMKEVVKSFGEDKAYSAEIFSMFESGGKVDSGIDLYNAREHFDFLVSVAFLTENSEHIHYEDLNYASTIVRFLKSMAPEKEAVILYGGNGTAHRYVMDPTIDLKIWLWEALSVGGRFWNCNFTGSYPAATYDRRNAYHNTEVYDFVRVNEKLLAHHAPVATVGVYYSRPTRLFYRNQPAEGDGFDEAIKGVGVVLDDNHIPYDFIPDDQLSPARIKKYKVIVLPDIKCLSDQEIMLLKQFVENGGSLVATYETSLYDEAGNKRDDFGLSDVLGCHFTGEKMNTRKDCYQHIADPSHPLVLPDSPDTELLINAGFTLLCKAEPAATKICTYVPVVHNQPPEKAWTNDWVGEFPTVLENTYGQGKVIYFANQPDKLAHSMGHPDVRNLLHRAVVHLAVHTIPLTTNAPESVHVGLTQSTADPTQYIVSLVNTTSGPGRPVRSLVPVTSLTIELKLDGKSLKNYAVMKSQGECRVQMKGNVIEIVLEKLEDYFSVQLTVV